MPGTARKLAPGAEVRNGQVVDPETMAAFYRHRTESLQNSHTTAVVTPPKPVAPPQEPMGIFDYIISAMAGHPGSR